MHELRGRLLLAGRLVPGRLRIENGRIATVETQEQERRITQLPVIAPGLVDLHVHGFGGHDPLERLDGMALALARAGTTSFQPTLLPDQPAVLGALAERTWRCAEELASPSGAAARSRVLGLHLEGPFVNPVRVGALPPAGIASPSVAALREILGPSGGNGRGVRTMTLAPELPGAAELIGELVRCGVRVSLGHSDATAAEARDATHAGASGATHLFNAMRPLHHREVGLAGFALTEDLLHAELIGDLVHVGADAVSLALAARGPRGLCLVSDALPGAGSGCDVFHWHGREHRIRDGAAFHPPRAPGAEPTLAGSAIPVLEMVRRLVRSGALSLEEALTMAAETPARALGLERELGVLAPGAHADLLLLDAHSLELLEVRVGGEPVEGVQRRAGVKARVESRRRPKA